MWKVTLKGIWAKKVRFLLTGVAVILGVAFVSGTFVLTATISSTFDKLFTEIYQNTDAVVRAKQTFDSNFGGGRGRVARRRLLRLHRLLRRLLGAEIAFGGPNRAWLYVTQGGKLSQILNDEHSLTGGWDDAVFAPDALVSSNVVALP